MRITPNQQPILALVQQADEGAVCLPNFQRDYVWKRDQVADLLRSALRGYFIGTFLLLACDEDEPPFQPQTVRGARTKLKQPRAQWLVLDGQQRITSMLYALTAADYPLRDTKEPRRFFVDLRKLIDDPDAEEVVVDVPISDLDELSTRTGQYERWMLPFAEILKASDFMAWRDGLDDHIREHQPGQHEVYRREQRARWTKPINDFQNFQVATVELPRVHEGDRDALGQVCAIFEKLNSTGTDLSVFDLLTARLYRSGIRLRDLWSAACVANPRLRTWSEGKPDKDKFGVLVLRVLALHRDLELKAKTLVDLQPPNFERDWMRAATAVERGLELVEHVDDSGFGVFDRKWMPNMALLPPLAALRWEIDERKLGHAERADLRHWYWSSVFLERYSGAVDSTTRRDYVDMTTRWGLRGATPERFEPQVFREARRQLGPLRYGIREAATQTSSVYRGVFCLLAINGAKDWRRLEALRLQELEDHHVFPRGYCQRHELRGVNTIVNRTLISDETNRRITDKAPAEYLASTDIFPQGHDVLAAHFIDETAMAAMEDAEEGVEPEDADSAFTGFLRARERAIIARIRQAANVEPGADEPEPEEEPAAAGGLRRRIWPLPGGTRHYPKSLRRLLALIADHPTQDTFIDKLRQEFPQVRSRGTAYQYFRTIVVLGFARVISRQTELTDTGRAYLENGDLGLVRAALEDRIEGVATILESLRTGPMTRHNLRARLAEDGLKWETGEQLRFRLNWLYGAGVVVHKGDEYRLVPPLQP